MYVQGHFSFASVVKALAWIFLLTSSRAFGADWAVPSGDWNVASNWSPAAVPGAGTDAYINNSGQVQIPAGVAALASDVVAGRTGTGTKDNATEVVARDYLKVSQADQRFIRARATLLE